MLKNHQILQHVKNLEVITSIFITRKVRQTENELLFLNTWGNWSYKANNHSKIWRVFMSWIVVAKPTKHVLSHNTQYFISSVQFSVVSNSLRSHWLQHTRIPCPSPTPRAYSNSSPLSLWCHPTISSSVVPFGSCLQSFPASGSFQMICSLHQVDKVLEFPLQHQSFQWIFRTHFL